MVTRCIDPVCERARQVSKDGAEGPPELAENTADKQAVQGLQVAAKSVCCGLLWYVMLWGLVCSTLLPKVFHFIKSEPPRDAPAQDDADGETASSQKEA